MSDGTGGIVERRREPRLRARARAFMTRRGFPRLHGQVLDLSPNGMFVATGPMPIPEHHVVHVDLVHEAGVLAEIQRRAAIVVRRSGEGTAFKFF
ncbi:MAG: PilZ domain-containing protein [Gammaproteobacteria bacterium]|nr:PilZ domain-containing protein [Gammaproteobacteria bacterium]